MRRLPPWVWLMLAAVSGIIASVVWIMNQGARPAPAVERTVAALIAQKDIFPATRLGADQVQTAAWPQATLPKGAFTSIAELEGRVRRLPHGGRGTHPREKTGPQGDGTGSHRLIAGQQARHDR